MLPKLIDLGPIPIHTYGLMLALALLISVTLAARLGEEDGISQKTTWDLGFVVIISSILGAKLLLVLTSINYYLEHPGRLFSLEFLQAGGVYYGGLIGAVVASFIFIRRLPGLSFWRVADAAGPAIPLGQAIGRLGCFAAGCDYGCPTDLPWGVTYSSQYAHDAVGTPLGVAVHPYQLYESGAALVLCLLLVRAFRHRSFQGQVFCLYLMAYGVLRFILEFFRGDEDRGFLFNGLLSTSQFISILIVPAAFLAYQHLKKRKSGTR
jgi:phosphatidylglycerol:prolipoprotein diacylglycerol transferase